jgi:hypothetical protein
VSVAPPLPHGETVTLHRSGVTGQDEYGNDVYGLVDIPIHGCAVWPRSSSRQGTSEDNDARFTVISGLNVLVPPGVEVTPTDEMTVRGERWEVDGEPGRWRSFFTGREAGTELALRRVTG